MLKAYDFKCGKVFKETVRVTYLYHVNVELYHEHGIYHVRAFNHVNGSSSCDRLAWDNFSKLSDAKKRFTELKKIYKGK